MFYTAKHHPSSLSAYSVYSVVNPLCALCDRSVPHLLAGFLPITHGGQVVAHELLYERPRLGEFLLGRHRQEGEAEEEGEEGEEEFHFRSWSSELELENGR